MGAIYNDAYIRMAWSLTAKQSGRITNVKATNWKNNFGLELPVRRWAVQFTGEGQRIDELRFTAPVGVPQDEMKTKDAIVYVLSEDGVVLTAAEIAEATGLNYETIRKALTRGTDKFRNVGAGKKGEWRLAGLGELPLDDDDDNKELEAPY